MIESFYKILEDTPEDWETRSVFADWLQDHNNPLEKVQRFLIENKKYPKFHHTNCWLLGIDNNWVKFHEDYGCCILPDEIFKKIRHHPTDVWLYFKSIQEAEASLILAMEISGCTKANCESLRNVSQA